MKTLFILISLFVSNVLFAQKVVITIDKTTNKAVLTIKTPEKVLVDVDDDSSVFTINSDKTVFSKTSMISLNLTGDLSSFVDNSKPLFVKYFMINNTYKVGYNIDFMLVVKNIKTTNKTMIIKLENVICY